VLLSLASGAEEAKPRPPVQTDVFVARAGGVHTYRIPAMMVSPNGSLLVFCEARKQRISDASPTDMVLKRSTEGGKSWSAMQVLVRGSGEEAIMNPCPVVDRTSKSILLFCVNAHKDGRGHHRHLLLTSDDNGQTWSETHWDRALNECPCQASFIRYTDADRDDRSRLLFANPDVSGERYGVVKRTRMSVKLSHDEGKTWPFEKLIHAGPSSYSSLVRLPDGDIGLVYEGGQQHRREWIRFARISLEWLTDGNDRFDSDS